jgi:hypothetical protein
MIIYRLLFLWLFYKTWLSDMVPTTSATPGCGRRLLLSCCCCLLPFVGRPRYIWLAERCWLIIIHARGGARCVAAWLPVTRMNCSSLRSVINTIWFYIFTILAATIYNLLVVIMVVATSFMHIAYVHLWFFSARNTAIQLASSIVVSCNINILVVR